MKVGWRSGDHWLLEPISHGCRRPLIMGIVNVTPDSFSDGGQHHQVDSAIQHGRVLLEQGADLLDIGGESTRPGAAEVSIAEEMARVLPVIEALARETNAIISIDTSKAEVAQQALQAGAKIINDVRGFQDPAMARTLAESNAAAVMMHMSGTPRTMQRNPEYRDVVGEIREFLDQQINRLEELGVSRERICVDPGIGFGKTFEHNQALLRSIPQLNSFGCAVLIGTSRKSFLGQVTGRPVDQRQTASIVSALAAVVSGASVVRVHDVAGLTDAWKVWEAQVGWENAR